MDVVNSLLLAIAGAGVFMGALWFLFEGTVRIKARRRSGHFMFWPAAIVVGSIMGLACGVVASTNFATTLVLIAIWIPMACWMPFALGPRKKTN